MKDLFRSFYPYDEDEMSDIWKDCLFVVDTNILVELLSLSDDMVERFTTLFQNINKENRLWIPYHVALEFSAAYSRANKNIWNHSINPNITKLYDLKDHITKTMNEIVNDLNLKNIELFTEEDRNSLITSMDEIINEVEEYKKEKPYKKRNILILNKIIETFTNIGSNFNPKELADAIKEAEERYSKNIPPGYEDRSKDKNKTDLIFQGIIYPRKYGDYFIWKQIINFVESKMGTEVSIKKLILITNDEKEDWIYDHKARRELVEEMAKFGVDYFIIYNFTTFLEEASKYMGLKINKDEIDEIKNSDSNKMVISQYLSESNFGNYANIRQSLLDNLMRVGKIYNNQTPDYANILAENIISKSNNFFMNVRRLQRIGSLYQPDHSNIVMKSTIVSIHSMTLKLKNYLIISGGSFEFDDNFPRLSTRLSSITTKYKELISKIESGEFENVNDNFFTLDIYTKINDISYALYDVISHLSSPSNGF